MDLEAVLEAAARDPAERPAFYRALLAATVYVIGHVEGTVVDGIVPAGGQLALQSWERPDGSTILPFFTSVKALQRAIEGPSEWVALNARSLFETTRGSSLVLNPRSDYGKEFTPAEIEALLTAGVNTLPERRVVEKPAQVLLGQPALYPTALTQALARLFAKQPGLRAAYLALMQQPPEPQPALVIGLECEGDMGPIVREAGVVAQDMQAGPVDFVQVMRGEEGLSRYLLEETKPFYERGSEPPPGGLHGPGAARN